MALLEAGIIGGAGILANYLGGRQQSAAIEAANKNNFNLNKAKMEQDREFAQHGIKWRVNDAKAAGIDPLVALGAQTHSPSSGMIGMVPDTSPGEATRAMGQDISRAVSATMTRENRDIAMKSAVLSLENQQLNNEILKKRLINMDSSPTFPSPATTTGPLSGQGDAAMVVKPSEATASSRHNPAQQMGAVNDYGFARTTTGLAPIPSTDAKERMEDQLLPEIRWGFKNMFLPNFEGLSRDVRKQRPSTKEFPLPRGLFWRWNPYQQEYQPYGQGQYRPDVLK